MILIDRKGRSWVVLETAEKTYFRVASRIHPDLTAEHARDELVEFVGHLRYLKQSAEHPPLEVWKADREFDRIRGVVERRSDCLRLCTVLPEHDPGRTRPRSSPASRQHAAQEPQHGAPVPELAPESMLALCALLGAAQARGEAVPTHSELSRLTRLSVPEVRRAIGALVERGWIVLPENSVGRHAGGPRRRGFLR